MNLNRTYLKCFSFKLQNFNINERFRIVDEQIKMVLSGVTYFHSYAEPETVEWLKHSLEYEYQNKRFRIETIYIFHGID
jgi:hypothetical protein